MGGKWCLCEVLWAQLGAGQLELSLGGRGRSSPRSGYPRRFLLCSSDLLLLLSLTSWGVWTSCLQGFALALFTRFSSKRVNCGGGYWVLLGSCSPSALGAAQFPPSPHRSGASAPPWSWWPFAGLALVGRYFVLGPEVMQQLAVV